MEIRKTHSSAFMFNTVNYVNYINIVNYVYYIVNCVLTLLMYQSYKVSMSKCLVRFPASLASGSESGFQYPYRWGIFLCSPPEGTIVAEHGQLGAYWISEHLTKPLAQSHFCSLTGLATSTQVLSSPRSQLLQEADISLGFVIFSFHISHQPQFWICEQAGFHKIYWSCRTMVT